MLMDSTERQRRYVNDQKSKGGGLGVVFADAFLRGMRELGYKNPAWALCELIDNSIQASASLVAVRLGFEGSNRSKPSMLAVIDNGVGMIPDMISFAVRWGGTDREDDRTGFGRFGYGLPSACVSLAKRYTVYSKVKGGEWHSVTIDLDQLSAVASDIDAVEKSLKPKQAKPPQFATDKGDGLHPAKFESGTIIVLEDLDRLKRTDGWIMANKLAAKLMQHFGVIYRHSLPSPKIFVDDQAVQAVDPLFLMEHGRFFAETPVRAEKIETRAFEVETPTGRKGRVKVRASFLPVNFQLADPKSERKGKKNARFEVMRDSNGLLICRAGRQIDCISPREHFTKFQSNDVHLKIEIDFDPELDEAFGVTTSKQQIVIDDWMWDHLEGKGRIRDLIKDLRRRFDEDMADHEERLNKRESSDEPRPSEQAMMETEKFAPTTDRPTPEQAREAARNLEAHIQEVSEATGKPAEHVKAEHEALVEKRSWKADFQAVPEGPFYRPERLGERKRVIINTLHPFYTRVYNAPDASAEVRAGLELLLMVIGDAELRAKGDFETFYKNARGHWSERLANALSALCPTDAMRDKAASFAERMQTEPHEEPATT
jgi:Histidine kinase-, DNA gyrase B-, and HSP90-like ATPase